MGITKVHLTSSIEIILYFAFAIVIGWGIIDRVIIYLKEVITAHQWRKYYKDEESRRQ